MIRYTEKTDICEKEIVRSTLSDSKLVEKNCNSITFVVFCSFYLIGDNDSSPGYRGFPAGTCGKVVVSVGKTLENGRKVEAVIR
jgi:hypothetical protein